MPRRPASPCPHLDRRQDLAPPLVVGACRANNSRTISSSRSGQEGGSAATLRHAFFGHGPSLGHPRAARAESFWRGAPPLRTTALDFTNAVSGFASAPDCSTHSAPTPCPALPTHLDRRQNFTPHLAVGACRANDSRAISSSGWLAGGVGCKKLLRAARKPRAITRAPQGGPIRVLFACVPPLREPHGRPRLHKCSVKFLPPRPIAGQPVRVTPQGAAGKTLRRI